MKKVVVILVIVAVVTALSVAWYRSRRDARNASELLLHGNIDLRQVDLAFNGSQRIAAVLVEEGDRVEAGQVVGYLEMDRLKISEAQATAQVQAQTHVVEKLENGTRPEEILRAASPQGWPRNSASTSASRSASRSALQRRARAANSSAS